MQDVNWVALTIFVLLFGFITWLGFAAANWRKLLSGSGPIQYHFKFSATIISAAAASRVPSGSSS